METERAALSSAASTVEGVTKLVEEMATTLQGSPREDISHALFEAERALRAASRRLQAAERLMTRT